MNYFYYSPDNQKIFKPTFHEAMEETNGEAIIFREEKDGTVIPCFVGFNDCDAVYVKRSCENLYQIMHNSVEYLLYVTDCDALGASFRVFRFEVERFIRLGVTDIPENVMQFIAEILVQKHDSFKASAG